MNKPSIVQEEIHRNGMIYGKGYDSSYWEAREFLLTDTNFIPTAQEIETGLTHYEYMERLIWARLKSYKPTREQVERGLMDCAWSVRMVFTKRADYPATENQIHRGITDMGFMIREAWAKRMDYTPTAKMIEIGLEDNQVTVRTAWTNRLREEQENTLAGSVDETCSTL